MSNNQLAEKEGNEVVTPGFSSLESFELAQRTAKLLSKSTLVPDQYQDNISNCVIALNMANRMNADPLMVMQNLYIVHGKPGWSSQFLISTFNTCGRFTSIRYEFVGERGTDEWCCRAWTTEKETGERLESTLITIEMAKAEGWYGKKMSKWKTMPEQMLRYRAAAFLIRAYAPEIAMGMHTKEEIVDITPGDEDVEEVNVMEEIKQNANSEEIDFDIEEDSDQDKESDVEEADQEDNSQQEEQKQVDTGPDEPEF